jgi:hypothetical protein
MTCNNRAYNIKAKIIINRGDWEPFAGGGLTNQLIDIMSGLKQCKVIGIHTARVVGFRADMFVSVSAPLSLVLDIKKTNKALSRIGLPILEDKDNGPEPGIEIRPKYRSLKELYGPELAAFCPSAWIRNLSERRMPLGDFDTVMLRLGIDEVAFYCMPGVHHEHAGARGERVSAWIEGEGREKVDAHVKEICTRLDQEFDGTRPVWVCTSVGKNPRHAVMEKYLEAIVRDRPYLIWERSIPDPRREICAMIDMWICVKGGKHVSLPGGSTLSRFIREWKQRIATDPSVR